jgi:hypothetical protein
MRSERNGIFFSQEGREGENREWWSFYMDKILNTPPITSYFTFLLLLLPTNNNNNYLYSFKEYFPTYYTVVEQSNLGTVSH